MKAQKCQHTKPAPYKTIKMHPSPPAPAPASSVTSVLGIRRWIFRITHLVLAVRVCRRAAAAAVNDPTAYRAEFAAALAVGAVSPAPVRTGEGCEYRLRNGSRRNRCRCGEEGEREDEDEGCAMHLDGRCWRADRLLVRGRPYT